jgi:heme-degrading monooxygenase HmoA
MLLKWIECEVVPGQRAVFHTGQRQWRVLCLAPGLIGQAGGWSDDRRRAFVLGLWASEADYRTFFAHLHDAVADRNGQAEAIAHSSVALADVVLEMPGAADSLARGLVGAEVLRIADCQLKPERASRFVDAQARVWAPGMAEAPGMLGGVFGAVRDQPDRFLVATLWSSMEAHDAYARQRVTALREGAGTDDDVEQLVGRVIALVPAWTVVRA